MSNPSRSRPSGARLLAAAAIAALVAALVPTTTDAASADPVDTQQVRPTASKPADQPLVRASKSFHITLITGDAVTFRFATDGSIADVEFDAAPRADGSPVTFTRLESDDAYLVLPSDAAMLVQKGRLDQRLFDLNYLVHNGYTDRKTKTTPRHRRVRRRAGAGEQAPRHRRRPARHSGCGSVGQHRRIDRGGTEGQQ